MTHTASSQAITEVLPPELGSVARARNLVHEVAVRWGLGPLAEDAALVASELVTNAVLHARTDLRVTVLHRPGGMRIEVWDGSPDPVVPPLRPEDQQAATLLDDPDDIMDVEELLITGLTGRGLALVAAISTDWGVQETSGAGKSVWAEIGQQPDSPNGPAGPVTTLAAPATAPASVRAPAAAPPAVPPAAPAAPSDAPPAVPPAAPAAPSDAPAGAPSPSAPASRASVQPEVGDLRAVRLIAMPTLLVLESERNLNDLLRELQVVDLGSSAYASAPGVGELRDLLEQRWPWRTAIHRAALLAVQRGDRLMDITLSVTGSLASWLEAVSRAGRELLDSPASESIISLGGPAEVVAFRSWWIQEVAAQLAGRPPQACPLPIGPWAGGPPTPQEVEERAELDARRGEEVAELERLLEATASSGEVAAVVLERAQDTLGAAGASLCLLGADHETVAFAYSVGYPEPVVEAWPSFPLSGLYPASEAIRTGRTVAIRTSAERDSLYPALVGTVMVDGGALVCIPLLGSSGPAFGALVMSFGMARDFTSGDIRFLESIAAATGRALDRVRTRLEAADLVQLNAAVEGAAAALDRAASASELAGELVRLCVPLLADWCAVHLVDPAGHPALVALHHASEAKTRLAREIDRRWPARLDDGPVGRAITTGETTLMQVIPDDAAAGLVEPERLDLVAELGLASLGVVPIRSATLTYGALTIANDRGKFIGNPQFRAARRLGIRGGEVLDRLSHRLD